VNLYLFLVVLDTIPYVIFCFAIVFLLCHMFMYTCAIATLTKYICMLQRCTRALAIEFEIGIVIINVAKQLELCTCAREGTYSR
jgi:hypothetical protein